MGKHQPTNRIKKLQASRDLSVVVEGSVQSTPGLNAGTKLKMWLALVVALFAFLLYAQCISFDYAFDDIGIIKENKYVTQGVSGICEILMKDYWSGYHDSNIPEYRPASLIMFAIEWQLFPNNPKIGHFINIFLYAVSGWVLFLVLSRLFKKQNIFFSFAITILFLSHPVHTEVVANIKSRDEILCFLFFIVSTLFLLKYLESGATKYIVFSLTSYFISLLSKETGITFIAIIPLILFAFTQTDYKSILKTTLLFLVPVMFFFLIRYQVLQGMPDNNYSDFSNSTYIYAPDFISRIATAFFILLRYISVLLFPHPLSYDYSYAEIVIHKITDPISLFSFLIHSILGIYAIIIIRKKSILSFAILFYFITISPVSNLFILISSQLTMAERFLYAPSLGYCIVLVWLIFKTTGSLDKNINPYSFRGFIKNNSTVAIPLFIIASLYSVKTFTRSRDWENNFTLFSHDVRIADKSANAHFNYGVSLAKDKYMNESDELKKLAIIDSAIAEISKAIDIYNNNPAFYKDLGLTYEKKGDYLKAIKYYEITNSFRSNSLPPIDIMKKLGELYIHTHQYDKAINILDSVLILDPKEETFANKGIALFYKGNYSEAISMFMKALELNPNSSLSYLNIGAAYINLGQFENALNSLKKGEEINPMNLDILTYLAITYKAIGDHDKSAQYFKKANRLKNTEVK